MCIKTESAVSIINRSLKLSQVKVPVTEGERVQLIRTALAVHAKRGRADLVTAARMLADACKVPAVWHAVINRTLGASVAFQDAVPARLVGVCTPTGWR